MATNTSIEWADKTWSPLIGCDRVSPACDMCYAAGIARIRQFNPNPKISGAFAGTTKNDGNGVDWTGQVNLLHDRLTQPLAWKKPQKVFVNSMSDLFHKDVPVEFIAQIFGIMALTPHHTYQILTKRHARMRAVLSDPSFQKGALVWAHRLKDDRHEPSWNPGEMAFTRWPLPNVWLGVSVENQQWADIRIPALLDTPAAVRWISAEPLLGPIDLWGPLDRWGRGRPKLTYWLPPGRPQLGPERTTDTGLAMREVLKEGGGPTLAWVVAGGETGAKARPSHPDWFRTLRDQCAQSGVPFFFKQWGDWGPMWPLDAEGRVKPVSQWRDRTMANDGTLYAPGDLSYPDGPRYGEALRADHGRAHLTAMYRTGKKAAGRELDGREHNEYPLGLS